jgi:2-keto-3-deoxy-L-rhamnonate aldolase
MLSPPPAGIFVPVPTFFVKRDSPSYNSAVPPIDIETQVAHGVFLAKRGIRGLVLLGSTGEAVHLTRTERQIVIKSVRDGMAQHGFPDFPLMAGTATQSIEETIDLLNESAAAGANFGLVLAPGYFAGATSQEGLGAWFTAVADKSSIPILMCVA